MNMSAPCFHHEVETLGFLVKTKVGSESKLSFRGRNAIKLLTEHGVVAEMQNMHLVTVILSSL